MFTFKVKFTIFSVNMVIKFHRSKLLQEPVCNDWLTDYFPCSDMDMVAAVEELKEQEPQNPRENKFPQIVLNSVRLFEKYKPYRKKGKKNISFSSSIPFFISYHFEHRNGLVFSSYLQIFIIPYCLCPWIWTYGIYITLQGIMYI